MSTLAEFLGDPILFRDGDWVESKDQDQNGDVRLIQLADIGEGEWLDKSRKFLTAEKSEQLRCTELKPGDLLVSRMPEPLGRACLFPGGDQKCVTVVDVCIIRVDPRRVCAKYLMYMLNSPACRQEMLKFASGTTRKRISRRNLEKVKVLALPLSKQEQIAEILEKATNLKAKVERSNAELDKLRESLFIDMFGEPSQEWHRKPIADLAVPGPLGMRTGPFGSDLLKSEFVESGIKVLGIDNVVNNSFSEIYSRYITSEKYEQLKRYSVQPGDVLVSIMGTCGRCAIAPENLGTAINTKHLCCITLNQSECLPEFLHAYFLQSRSAQRYLQSRARGAIMTGLNMGIIKAMPVEIPPMPLQVEFSKKLKVISRLHTNIRKQLQEVTSLFDSIQAQAFSGEI